MRGAGGDFLKNLSGEFGDAFLANVVSGWLFKKYGFLAPLVMRLSFYLVWHIIYGGLITG
jgi:hypothetical protein